MSYCSIAVIPVIIGPLQVLITILPALLLSLAGLIIGMLKPSAMWAFLKLLWRQKIPLIVMAGIVTGLIYLGRTFAGPGGPTSAQVAGTDWPMFRGGPERRGSNDSSNPPTAGGLNWSYKADVQTFYASPTLVGNRVYITSADKGPMKDKGAVYCLDADTGALDWKSAPNGYLATFSSPSISGKYLVCGEGLHLTKSARVICMDITQRGKVLWTYTTRSHVESTPCIDQGRVYVGAGDDGYYCFRLEPGADGQAQLLWHAPHERCIDAETSPAAHDGLMFAGLGMGGKAVIALNADTGEQVWRTDTPCPVFGPPTVVNGSVIIGMGNGNFIESAEEVKRKELEKLSKAGKTDAEIAAVAKTMGTGGEIWCLEEKTGKVRWKFITDDTVLGAVAAGKDRLFAASGSPGALNGYVYSLSMDGKLINKWNARAPLLTSPVLCGQYVYVVTETGMLFGRRADDLEGVWEARLSFTGPFISSPAVARGHVYVGSAADGLLCLGVPGAQQRELRWDGFGGGPGRGGNVDAQPLPEKGKLSWRFPVLDDADQAPNVQIAAPPACLNGMLYVPADGGRKGLLAVRETTEKGEARGTEVWFAATTNGVRLSPAATSNLVFFVDGQKSDADRRLHCLASADGGEIWTLPVTADASGEFVLTDDGGLIVDAPGQLTAFETSGRILWRSPCGNVYGMPVTSETLVALTTDQPAGLSVLDRPSGRVLWRLPLDTPAPVAPLVRKHRLYLGTASGIAARHLADGRLLWDAPAGAPGAPLVLAKNRLAYTTTDGQLVILNSEDGSVEKTVPGATPGFPPLVAPDLFVYAGKSGLMVCPMTDESPSLWTKTDWLGPLTCAPVMAGSRIYIATGKKGLVCLKGK